MYGIFVLLWEGQDAFTLIMQLIYSQTQKQLWTICEHQKYVWMFIVS